MTCPTKNVYNANSKNMPLKLIEGRNVDDRAYRPSFVDPLWKNDDVILVRRLVAYPYINCHELIWNNETGSQTSVFCTWSSISTCIEKKLNVLQHPFNVLAAVMCFCKEYLSPVNSRQGTRVITNVMGVIRTKLSTTENCNRNIWFQPLLPMTDSGPWCGSHGVSAPHLIKATPS